MSGVYNIKRYMMTWKFSNCEQGSCTNLFQYESCENIVCNTGNLRT